MAIVTEVASNRDSSRDRPLTSSETQTTSDARRSWLVVNDNNDDGPTVAETATGIPVFGDAHPKDAMRVVTRIRATAVPNSPKVFRVDVDYGKVGEGDPSQFAPSETWTSQSTELESWEDINGREYKNSAGDFFEQGLRIPWTDVVWQYRQPLISPYFNASVIFTHVNRVNSAPIMTRGIPSGCGLLRSLTAELRNYGGVPWFMVGYELAIRDRVISGIQRGWKHVVADIGVSELVNGVRKPIYDQGLPVRRPVKLKANGTRAADGDPIRWLVFDIYPSANMAEINLA